MATTDTQAPRQKGDPDQSPPPWMSSVLPSL